MMQLETSRVSRFKWLPAAFIVVVAMVLNMVTAAAIFAEEKVESISGYLVDRSCAAMYKNEHVDPVQKLKNHTKSCALEPSCNEAGYTVYSGGKWIDLDSSTSDLAKKMLEGSKTARGHKCKMTGVFKRSGFHATTLTEVKE